MTLHEIHFTQSNKPHYFRSSRARAKLTDAGNYTCKAVNLIGTTTRSMQVSVIGEFKIFTLFVTVISGTFFPNRANNENLSLTAPPRTLTPSNISISKLSGDDVSLDCITSVLYGYPEPSIHWSFNGDPLTESSQNVYVRYKPYPVLKRRV